MAAAGAGAADAGASQDARQEAPLLGVLQGARAAAPVPQTRALPALGKRHAKYRQLAEALQQQAQQEEALAAAQAAKVSCTRCPGGLSGQGLLPSKLPCSQPCTGVPALTSAPALLATRPRSSQALGNHGTWRQQGRQQQGRQQRQRQRLRPGRPSPSWAGSRRQAHCRCTGAAARAPPSRAPSGQAPCSTSRPRAPQARRTASWRIRRTMAPISEQQQQQQQQETPTRTTLRSSRPRLPRLQRAPPSAAGAAGASSAGGLLLAAGAARCSWTSAGPASAGTGPAACTLPGRPPR